MGNFPNDLIARLSLPFWPQMQANAVEILKSKAAIHAVEFQGSVLGKLSELEGAPAWLVAQIDDMKARIAELKHDLKTLPRGSWVLAGCYFLANATTFATEFLLCWTTLNPLFGSDPFSLQGILLGFFVPSVLFALKPVYEWLIEEPYREALAHPETHGRSAIWIRRVFLLAVAMLNVVTIVLMAINRDEITAVLRALAQGQDQISIHPRPFFIALGICAALDGALFFWLVTFYASAACRRHRNAHEVNNLEERLPLLEKQLADSRRTLTEYQERARNLETLAQEEERSFYYQGLLALAQRLAELRRLQSARERVDLLSCFGIGKTVTMELDNKLPN